MRVQPLVSSQLPVTHACPAAVAVPSQHTSLARQLSCLTAVLASVQSPTCSQQQCSGVSPGPVPAVEAATCLSIASCMHAALVQLHMLFCMPALLVALLQGFSTPVPKPSPVTGQASQPVFGIPRVANPRHPQTQFGYWSGAVRLCYAPLPGSAPHVHKCVPQRHCPKPSTAPGAQ